jgi:hypothetical protein
MYNGKLVPGHCWVPSVHEVRERHIRPVVWSRFTFRISESESERADREFGGQPRPFLGWMRRHVPAP